MQPMREKQRMPLDLTSEFYIYGPDEIRRRVSVDGTVTLEYDDCRVEIGPDIEWTYWNKSGSQWIEARSWTAQDGDRETREKALVKFLDGWLMSTIHYLKMVAVTTVRCDKCRAVSSTKAVEPSMAFRERGWRVTRSGSILCPVCSGASPYPVKHFSIETLVGS